MKPGVIQSMGSQRVVHDWEILNSVNFPNFILLYQICFDHSSSFVFNINLSICFTISTKILQIFWSEQQIYLLIWGITGIFTKLNLPIHQHNIPLHSHSCNFFQQDLWFSAYKSSTFWRFVSKCISLNCQSLCWQCFFHSILPFLLSVVLPMRV